MECDSESIPYKRSLNNITKLVSYLQEKNSISIRNISRLMAFSDKVSFCSESHTNPLNNTCG
jgi:hypothetical protein